MGFSSFFSSFSITSFFAVFFLAIALYSFGLVIYRLYFHPLARFPGPKLAAATKWYEFYFDVLKGAGGQFMFETDRMHEQYGPIVRVNPDELHIKDPEFYDTLYRAGSAVRDKYPPSCLFAGTPLGVFGTVKHEPHRARKAPLAAYFSKRVYRTAEPIFQSQIEDFSDRLRNRQISGKVTDVRVDFLSTATEIVSRYAFGHPIGLHDSPHEAVDWLLTVKAIAAVSPFFKQFPYVAEWLLPCPEWLVKVLYPVFAPSIRLHGKMQREAVEACKKVASDEKVTIWDGTPETRPQTVFEAILQTNLPLAEKTPGRLDHDAFTAIFGGSDPAARTMTNCTFWLLTNPSVLQRLQQELDTATPDPSKRLRVQQVEELPYLNAVVKESLRLQAISTSRLEVVCPSEVLRYKDWVIHPGTAVGMSLRHTLHDPSIYPDPHAFKPERWLDAAGKIDVAKDKYYIPFHRGHRMCLGYAFATTMMLMTLATVFRRFDLELVDTIYERDVKIVRDCFIGETEPDTKGVKIRVLKERK
ncbi:putative flavonoid 3-hydroxylase [Mytilinidion resinicola]|uniref:Flavonoid 3-hydroxylase n=1 Tax=Mytilinidion resinicola TaxID=574789 RepID=A0A6A6Z2F6_9PEZI|nr:putative flavonoid 3-hydroxylase [Mytilinidion resinicola]KAF2815342.1 putative flavonoid 3-hydroxylase [Mytilinidion resinicola]